MNPELSALLCSRYPALYGSSFCFECLDGWAGILDALSETLVWHAEIEGRPAAQARQIKEKYGSLRWYHGETERDDGAIALAEAMSARICERTGRPGRLGVRAGWWATRAPGLEPGLAYRLETDRPPLEVTREMVHKMRADVFDGELEVPSGWLDVVDGALRQIGHVPGVIRAEPAGTVSIVIGRPVSVPVRASRVWRGASGDLRVDYVGGGAYAQGIVACATALARRIDPENGHVRLES